MPATSASPKRHLIAAVLLAVSAQHSHAAQTIVANSGRHPSTKAAGHAEAEVNWLDADMADDTVCTEAFAALELRDWTGRARARKREVVYGGPPVIVDDDKVPRGDLILIGGPASNAVSRQLAPALGVDAKKLAALGPEGYRIRSKVVDGRRVTLIAGGSRVGTLYGVYDLLHRLGARWLAPGRMEGQPARTLDIPDLDVTETPDFLTRGFHAWQDRGDEHFLLWMARNRLNYWCVQQSNHPLLRKLGIQMSCGGHTAQSMFLNPYHAYPYDHPRFKGDENKPKDPHPPSDGYKGDANKDGKLSYFEAHPEWFARVKGKRIPGYRGEFGTNYCTSNEHATTEFMKNYAQALIDGPWKDATVVRFWTLDVGKWCQCMPCKALGTPTDRNLLLVHRLDREIKKARAAGRINRPIIIRFLAYADVLQPPSRALPADFDYATCSATFFPIVRSYVRNFNDPRSRRNGRYNRQLHGWAAEPKRHYRGQLCIGEYYNVSGYKCLPIVFMHTMANDIPYYHKIGARHFHYMHVTTKNWGFKALTNYQMARQLWDVETDCEALWGDYFDRRFGRASKTMRAFYECLEKMLCNVTELKYGLARRLDRGASNLFPTPELRFERKPGVVCNGPTLTEIVGHATQGRALLDQLFADVTKGHMGRGGGHRLPFEYAERTILYYYECVQAFQLGRAGQRGEARRHFDQARRLAELLRKDTASTKHSSSHANAPNAFAATRATRALEHLAKLLAP